MKHLILLISFLSASISFAQKPFARIENEKFVIETDTLGYKKYLNENLASERKTPLIFDKVEIRKQTMLTSKDQYYFVVATDFKNHVRISKWLNRVGNNLYSNDNLDGDDLFENTYLICIGEENCQQNVFILDSKRYWTCGESMTCSKEERTKCKVMQSVIFPD